MVSIKVIADGLSKQIEQAIEGKVNIEQAEILCKSVDSLVKLARLQIEMAQIDWNGSDERPVLEMEKISGKPPSETAKALTATAMCETPVPAKESIQTPVVIGLGDRLMAWIYQLDKDNFTIPQIASRTGSDGQVESVKQTIGYWVNKGHLEKVGSGASTSYRVITREFFKP